VGGHAIETRQGGELIVFDEEENFVVRVFAGAADGKKDVGGVAWIATAEILEAEEGFELVVEGGDFRRSYFVRNRKDDAAILELGHQAAVWGGGAHMARPDAIGSPGEKRKQ